MYAAVHNRVPDNLKFLTSSGNVDSSSWRSDSNDRKVGTSRGLVEVEFNTTDALVLGTVAIFLGVIFLVYVLFCCYVWGAPGKLWRVLRSLARSSDSHDNGAGTTAVRFDGTAERAAEEVAAVEEPWGTSLFAGFRHARQNINTPPPRYSAICRDELLLTAIPTTPRGGPALEHGTGPRQPPMNRSISSKVKYWRVVVEVSSVADCEDYDPDLPVFESPVAADRYSGDETVWSLPSSPFSSSINTCTRQKQQVNALQHCSHLKIPRLFVQRQRSSEISFNYAASSYRTPGRDGTNIDSVVRCLGSTSITCSRCDRVSQAAIKKSRTSDLYLKSKLDRKVKATPSANRTNDTGYGSEGNLRVSSVGKVEGGVAIAATPTAFELGGSSSRASGRCLRRSYLSSPAVTLNLEFYSQIGHTHLPQTRSKFKCEQYRNRHASTGSYILTIEDGRSSCKASDCTTRDNSNNTSREVGITAKNNSGNAFEQEFVDNNLLPDKQLSVVETDVFVSVLLPSGLLSKYVPAFLHPDAACTYVAVIEANSTYPIQACSVQISSDQHTVEMVSIECLAGDSEVLECVRFGMVS